EAGIRDFHVTGVQTCALPISAWHSVLPRASRHAMLTVMIKYDLKCRRGHVFEAWFRDSAAYDEQVEANEVACPDCGARKVEKARSEERRVGKEGRGRSWT